ncbi:MAG: HD domain-containing protein [Nitrospirae bacterium]|nr:HD domain-containing protein [Nitrospirota bacterium]
MLIANKVKSDKELINALAAAIKTTQIHSLNNIAVINAANKLLEILNSLLKDGTVTLELTGEFFHLNGFRIRYSTDSIFSYNFLVKEFKARELGSITFKEALREADINSLLSGLMSTGFSTDNPFEKLSAALDSLENISVEKIRKLMEDTDLNRKKIIKKTYLNAVTLTKTISNKLNGGEKISFKRTKRIIEVIVDQIVEDEPLLIGMTTVKDYDEYTYYHSVNVSIFSLSLGHRLGLTKKALSELGLSALLHDIGKTGVPLDVLNKSQEFTDEDWMIIKKHPIWGVYNILKIQGINASSMTAAISAFEHHLYYDLSGYPKLKTGMQQDLFSKIITIADRYDAMTSARVYARIPLPPDRALSMMLTKSGTELDPYLVKVFINMIGIYPIGTLVMLDSSELGLVFESNSNQDFNDRPRVLIIMDNTGTKRHNIVDLMEKNNDGNFKRTIIKTLDPNQYNINLAEYLL